MNYISGYNPNADGFIMVGTGYQTYVYGEPNLDTPKQLVPSGKYVVLNGNYRIMEGTATDASDVSHCFYELKNYPGFWLLANFSYLTGRYTDEIEQWGQYATAPAGTKEWKPTSVGKGILIAMLLAGTVAVALG